MRWQWASAIILKKTGAFKQIGVALSGGRDSLLCLLIAHRWRYATPSVPREAVVKQKAETCCAPLHADALFLFRYVQCRRDRSDGAWDSFVILSIEDAFAREVEATKRCCIRAKN